MVKEKILNIPNSLSAYRLLALPFIVYSIFSGDKSLFIILISINLITDILDGLIARIFHMQTALGAKLDSVADIGTLLMAFLGMIILESAFVSAYKIPFLILIVMWILPQIISFIRFKRFPSFHLWSNKILGYIQGIFIFTYFVIGFNEGYFYFMIAFSVMAYLEELIIVVKIPQLRSNIKSIFIILKEHNSIR